MRTIFGNAFHRAFLCLAFLMSVVPAWAVPKPRILLDPVGLSVISGGTAIFTVEVFSTSALTYQWRLNGTNVPGATAAICTVTNVGKADAGDYTVYVQNAGGWVVSKAATLVVLLDTVTNVVSNVVTPVVKGMTTNGFRIIFSGPTGSNYVIQASSDLANWTSIATNPAPAGTVDFTDSAALSLTSRFYRALVR